MPEEAQVIPKPKYSRRRAKNNPKPTIDDICQYQCCGRPYAQLHEVFFGSGLRQLSIKHGLQIRLCADHHTGALGPHQNREYDLQLKREYQALFEREHSREEFIALFRKSYL